MQTPKRMNALFPDIEMTKLTSWNCDNPPAEIFGKCKIFKGVENLLEKRVKGHRRVIDEAGRGKRGEHGSCW